tara:strand:- start:135 stop:371 length:237 start_codon:yes stop_codon:yes gene_type:complete
MTTKNTKTNESFLGDLYMSKFAVNNNIPIIRNIVYKRINDILKDIKEQTPEMSDFFKDKIDINMKNTINKILNDYKTQ